MKNKVQYIIVVLAVVGATAAFAFAQNKAGVAVAAKVKGKTEMKVESGTYQPNLRRGSQLNNKDWVKTLDDGYIALMFIDDKSLLKLRENSEVEIRADRYPDALDKKIALNFGKIKAEISPQISGEFIITTPTSVASVKGTIFWIISTPAGDQVIGMEGSVLVTNIISGDTTSASPGQTVNSTPDGNITVEDTPEGGVPDDPGEDMVKQRLSIKLINEEGDEKTIIIEY